MSDQKVRYVVENLFPYMWYKLKFLKKQTVEPKFEVRAGLSSILIVNLRRAVWVHRKISILVWRPFLRKFANRMTLSLDLYIIYTIFVINESTSCIRGTFGKFIMACSLVTAMAEFTYDKGYTEFLDCSSQILIAFFEVVLKDTFYHDGGWKGLEEYILKQNYLKFYNCPELAPTEGNPVQKLEREEKFAEIILNKAQAEINAERFCGNFEETDVEKDPAVSEIMKYFSARISTQVPDVVELASLKKKLCNNLKEVFSALPRSKRDEFEEHLSEDNLCTKITEKALTEEAIGWDSPLLDIACTLSTEAEDLPTAQATEINLASIVKKLRTETKERFFDVSKSKSDELEQYEDEFYDKIAEQILVKEADRCNLPPLDIALSTTSYLLHKYRCTFKASNEALDALSSEGYIFEAKIYPPPETEDRPPPETEDRPP
ncbi:hypothetical protein TNIN_31891, partial [Trichonephila inaurata madagascariensis]